MQFKMKSSLRGEASEIWRSGGSAIGISTDMLDDVGFRDLLDNLKIMRESLALRAARALSTIGADLLSMAVAIAPVETGDLRKSGSAVLFVGGTPHNIAQGDAEGGISADFSTLSRGSVGRNTNLSLEISFYRVGKKGFDVALWTHEDLSPYGRAEAQTPGTGPKYLERPFRANYRRYVSILRDSITGKKLSKDIRNASKITRKAGKFTVSRSRLDSSKLGRL